MIASYFNDTGFDTTDLLIVLGIIGYVIVKFADAKGWSPSAKTLRENNQDLKDRNAELEKQVERHEETLAELQKLGEERQEAIVTLKAKVAELERLSQAEVLERLVEVELKADIRHAETLVVLQEIATNTSPPVQVTER